MWVDPMTALYIGLFAGFMLGYAVGTLIWFKRTPVR